jgi:carbonic anhydrase
MKKLIRGVVDFRNRHLNNYRANFAHLALRQNPDALFIACSDSRVVPNTFASTDPGDLFVVRNVGNLVCPCGVQGISLADVSEFAAIEYAITELHVSDIVVCGHSECGAMRALIAGGERPDMPHLSSWLGNGKPALKRLRDGFAPDKSLSEVNQLSQVNVLVQLEHLRTYDIVREGIENGILKLHGWWFDLEKADVYAYDAATASFQILDEQHAKNILQDDGE